MYYIVGLGNPGAEYESTRHNIGFLVVDFLIENFQLPKLSNSKEYSGLFTRGIIGGQEVALLCPTTFMNNSGVAVRKLVPKEEISNLVVTYDDVALPFGSIKLSFGRGDGGHNGLKSIIDHLGSKDFIRVRVGVGPTSFWTGKIKVLSGGAMAKYVLGRFGSKEKEQLEGIYTKTGEVIKMLLKEGVGKAMNVYN